MCKKTDDNPRNIYMRRIEWTLIGVHQTFGLLTLIRERTFPHIEVTVKPLSFCAFFGLEINDWVRFPFQINLYVLLWLLVMLSLIMLGKMGRKAMGFEKFSDTRQNTKTKLPSKNYRFNYLSEAAKETLCTSPLK